MSTPEAPLPPPPPQETSSNWQYWVGGTLLVGAVVSGIVYFSQEGDPTPTCDTSIDADCDGIRNSFDPKPYDKDNSVYVPPLNPGNNNGYTPPGPGRITTFPPIVPGVPNNPVPRPTLPVPCNQRGGKDSNGNGFPDSCDMFPGDGDRDHDNLPDRYDSAPDNPDRDGDFIPDGNDAEPDVNKNTQERKEQEKRERERREREEQERKRRETPGYMYGQAAYQTTVRVRHDPQTGAVVIPRFYL